MTTTTVDIFAQAGYAVTTKLVDRVDNQGEPCEVCQIEGRYVDATVYGVVLGNDVDLVRDITLDCCVWCVPEAISQMDSVEAVTVELGDSVADDDRMHGPDCICVHRDAL